MSLFRFFLRDTRGAVTLDFVVLTAAMLTVGLVAGGTIGDSTKELGNYSVGVMANVTID